MSGNYTVTLRHDEGTIALTIHAESADEAARRICAIEGAPLRAVVSVTGNPSAEERSE
jgi:hypothetical protein